MLKFFISNKDLSIFITECIHKKFLLFQNITNTFNIITLHGCFLDQLLFFIDLFFINKRRTKKGSRMKSLFKIHHIKHDSFFCVNLWFSISLFKFRLHFFFPFFLLFLFLILTYRNAFHFHIFLLLFYFL
jgi:hypothetical protein